MNTDIEVLLMILNCRHQSDAMTANIHGVNGQAPLFFHNNILISALC